MLNLKRNLLFVLCLMVLSACSTNPPERPAIPDLPPNLDREPEPLLQIPQPVKLSYEQQMRIMQSPCVMQNWRVSCGAPITK